MKTLKRMWGIHLVTLALVVFFPCLALLSMEKNDALRSPEFWIILSTAYLIFSGVTQCAAWAEARSYNDGICRCCGKKLKCFDMDSQGGRGYSCKKCDHTVWVSYPVD